MVIGSCELPGAGWELNSNPLPFPAEPRQPQSLTCLSARLSTLTPQHAAAQTQSVPACAQAVPLKTGLTGLMKGSPVPGTLLCHSKSQRVSLKQTSVHSQPVGVTTHSFLATGTPCEKGGEVIPSVLTRDLCEDSKPNGYAS